jgi:hypothetical protein
MRSAKLERCCRHLFLASIVVFLAVAGSAPPCGAAPVDPAQVTVVNGNWGGTAESDPYGRGEHCAVWDPAETA